MFNKILLSIILLIVFSFPIHGDVEILVVQSVRIPPYEDALNGFLSVSDLKIKRVVLSELKEINLKEEIIKTNPPLVLAIGRDALMNVREVRDIPVVYIMVLAPQSILTHDDNFYGIIMNTPPEKQLETYMAAIPGLNNIGLIYNPGNTGDLVEKSQQAAEKMGVQLILRKAAKASDVPSIIKDMTGKISAFWMLPDITLMTPESIEFLLITSMEKNIPILTFSPKYVEIGALASISVDPGDMGRQAGELAQKIITGGIKVDQKTIPARKGVFTVNKKVAENLGIILKQEAYQDTATNK
ncbi:MAG: ABC transporter substrate-binding protein [Deltaproteobacteria bacterium]|nr:ABC transporter substrate-binding protein [Deltaproteobacteria bacterium]